MSQELQTLLEKFRAEGHKDDRGDAFLSGIRHAYETCADALEAALSAQPAERQGEFRMRFGACEVIGPEADVLHIAKIIGEPDDHPAAPVGVPDAKTDADYEQDEDGNIDTYCQGHMDGWNHMRDLWLAAAPSAPQGGGVNMSAQDDRAAYARAMSNGNCYAALRIEERHGLAGYPPELVSVGLNAAAAGEDPQQAITEYILDANHHQEPNDGDDA